MAKTEISKKLSSELEGTNALSEPLVVYTLVQIRKLMEMSSDKGFETLKFYCDWVLHAKLDRKGAKEIVELFEKIQEAVECGNIQLTDERCEHLFKQVLNADTFRKQLNNFLSANCICQNIFRNDDRWYEFLNCYGAIVHQVPLEINLKSRHIKKVVVTREETPGLPLEPNRRFIFALVWSPYKTDGTKAMNHKVTFSVPV